MPSRTKRNFCLIALLVAVQHAQALPIKLTFDDLFHSDSSAKYQSGYQEKGFNIGSSYNSQYALGNWGAFAGNFAGASALYNNYSGQKNTLTRADGGVFNIRGIDISELFRTGLGGKVQFTGYLADGSSIIKTVELDGHFGFETFLFSGFDNLKKLEWTSGASSSFMSQFRNLWLESNDSLNPAGGPVGVPDAGPTFGLLAVACAALFFIRRKFLTPVRTR